MDSNAGRFVSDEEAQAWMTRFDLGEILKVKGEEFEIESIEERRLILRPTSAEDRMQDTLRDMRDEWRPEWRPENRHDRRRREALERKEKP